MITNRLTGLIGPTTRTRLAALVNHTDLTRLTRMIALGPIAAGLVACASVNNPGERIADLPSAALPAPFPGDQYVFDDGYVERVQSISPQGVHWRIGNGLASMVRDADYTLPAYEWATPDQLARQSVVANSRQFWPIQAGSSNTVQTQLAVNNRGVTTTYQEQWRCKVGDSERLTLAIGRIDAQLVTCERRSDSGYHGHSQTWYHAASLGHWVRKIDATQGSWRVWKQRDLVAYRRVPRWLGLAGATQHEAQFQMELERLATGQQASIQTTAADTASAATFTTTLTVNTTFLSQHNTVCRQLSVQDDNTAQRTETFCRMADEWVLSAT
jgi:hypothetical protein